MKNRDQLAAVDSKMTPAQDSVSHRGRFNKPFLYTEPFLIFYISTATLKASNTVYIEHNLLFTVIIVINDTVGVVVFVSLEEPESPWFDDPEPSCPIKKSGEKSITPKINFENKCAI